MTDNNIPTPAEYVDAVMAQIKDDDALAESDKAIQDFADEYLALSDDCKTMGAVSLKHDQFVTVSCDGHLVSHAFDEGDPDDGPALLQRTMDLAIRNGVHIVGYYKATLTIDPDSFVAVTPDDRKACAERFVTDEREARDMIRQQITEVMGVMGNDD